MKDIVYSTLLAVSIVVVLSNITLAIADNAVASLEKLSMTNVSGGFFVEKKSTAVHPVYLQQGEYATITVIGDSLTDLDVYVYDPDGELTAYDYFNEDVYRINFYAKHDGCYAIEVLNRGAVLNEYELDAKWSCFE